MAASPIPPGYHTVTPYLTIRGVPGIIDFLTQSFDAKEQHRLAMPDGSVMHADVMIGDSHVMMGEARGNMQPRPASIYLYVPDCDALYHRAIAAGAASINEPRDEFYGDRVAAVSDSAGNIWWIATHKEDVPHEEFQKRAEEAMKSRR